MAWNDEKEIEEILKKVYPFMEQMNDVIAQVKDNTNGSVTLDNVGIAFNNKLVEIIQLYKRAGKTFYNSHIKNAIVFYLEDMTLNATSTLNEYLSLYDVELKKFGLKKQARGINDEAEQILSKYNELTRKIYDFSVEDNIDEAVKAHIQYNHDNGLSGGYDHYKNNGEEIIRGYNEELEQLGLSSQLPLTIVEELDNNKDNEVLEWIETNENQPETMLSEVTLTNGNDNHNRHL